jgi:hypothetical protein
LARSARGTKRWLLPQLFRSTNSRDWTGFCVGALILIILFSSKITLFAQNDQFSRNNDNAIDNSKKINIDDSRNRFPEILHDVKILLSEALIADHHLDTLEVIYNLSRIYDLLMEADQIGDMNQEDQEEFERFEKSFLDIYTHKLGTIRSSDAPVTAERFRRDITEALEPLEIVPTRCGGIVSTNPELTFLNPIPFIVTTEECASSTSWTRHKLWCPHSLHHDLKRIWSMPMTAIGVMMIIGCRNLTILILT